MGNLGMMLLKDPAALVELLSALLVAFYMLQLVTTHSRGQLRRTQVQRGQVQSARKGRRQSPATVVRELSLQQSSQHSSLPASIVFSDFNRALFLELSDTGAIFPAGARAYDRKRRAKESTERLKFLAVGGYITPKKRSLRRASAERIRLPQ